jgi:putative addiction module killer protein
LLHGAAPVSADRAAFSFDARLRSAKNGNFGDCKPIGEGVSEIRIDFGPGYRAYYAQEGLNLYLLIAGGDKCPQERDIKQAKAMWREIKSGATERLCMMSRKPQRAALPFLRR